MITKTTSTRLMKRTMMRRKRLLWLTTGVQFMAKLRSTPLPPRRRLGRRLAMRSRRQAKTGVLTTCWQASRHRPDEGTALAIDSFATLDVVAEGADQETAASGSGLI
jgi:hypothetical protein